MSEYTATREGYQRAMEWTLTGAADEFMECAEALCSGPSFYHIMNDQRLSYEDYIKGTAEWRGKTTEYKPVVHEFLRDGDQLAARMTGTIKVDDTETFFESFMFSKLDKDGKMEYLIERAIWGAVGGPPEHGAN